MLDKISELDHQKEAKRFVKFSIVGAIGAVVGIGEEWRADESLFGEAQSRVIVTIKDKDFGRLEKICKARSTPCEPIGRVKGASLVIGEEIHLPLDRIKDAWGGALEGFLRS